MAEALAEACLAQPKQRQGLPLVSQNLGAAFLSRAPKAEGKVRTDGNREEDLSLGDSSRLCPTCHHMLASDIPAILPNRCSHSPDLHPPELPKEISRFFQAYQHLPRQPASGGKGGGRHDAMLEACMEVFGDRIQKGFLRGAEVRSTYWHSLDIWLSYVH